MASGNCWYLHIGILVLSGVVLVMDLEEMLQLLSEARCDGIEVGRQSIDV